MASKIPALIPPPGHSIPPLLNEFAAWMERQDYQSTGCTTIAVAAPCWKGGELDERLKRDGFCFMVKVSEDQIIFMNRGKNVPPAVCMLGNEGATEVLATSFEQFLYSLAEKGTLEFTPTGAKSLMAWLKKRKVRVPRSKPFDFDAYLDRESGKPVKISPIKAVEKGTLPAAMQKFSPILQELAEVVGRPTNDPAMAAFFKTRVKRGMPLNVTAGGTKLVFDDTACGLSFRFAQEILHEQCPPIAMSKTWFVPYLNIAWITKEIGTPLPLGLKFGMKDEQLRRLLGTPAKDGKCPRWIIMLDPRRDLVLMVEEEDGCWLQVLESRRISFGDYFSNKTATGAFVAWAVTRGLLNESRFAAHASLLEAVGKQKKGTDLLDSVLSRGFWNTHLADRPGLRDFTEKYAKTQAAIDFKAVLGLPEIKFTGNESLKALNKLVSREFDFTYENDIVVKFGKKQLAGWGEFEERQEQGGKKSIYLRVWFSTKQKKMNEEIEINLDEIRELRRDCVHIPDDDWATVDKLTPVFDKRFAKWIKSKRK